MNVLHNLGEFDGYFLYKGLLNHYNPDQVNSIIDEANTFISIQNKLSAKQIIEWKDSLRIFPMSLNKLCKMFGIEGKLTPYNPKFRDLNMFNIPRLLNSFKNYALQDAKALFDALYTAQNIYWIDYHVDIQSVYSTATLSLKIYRTRFQIIEIFILPAHFDSFVRNAYFGGGTDVYKAYGKNIHHYDVNSLYPFAMLNPMPYDLVQNKIIKLNNRSLDNFFGYAKVNIICPLDMLRPVLPFHKEGKTIYPVGTWTGTYFTEELKAVQKLGYQIELIEGLEVTKAYLFNGFVLHFHNIKKNSTGVERETAKLQLNNLYGYFGRKQTGLITTNIKNENLSNLLSTRIVKTISPINDEYTSVLSYSNVNQDLLVKLNNELHIIGSEYSHVMSNVAIAAAVTSYARIVMIPIKLDPNTLYTDTDSAFTTKPMDPALLGPELGQYKDELKGQVINEAYFLGPKKYGYYIIYTLKITNSKRKAIYENGIFSNTIPYLYNELNTKQK